MKKKSCNSLQVKINSVPSAGSLTTTIIVFLFSAAEDSQEEEAEDYPQEDDDDDEDEEDEMGRRILFKESFQQCQIL